MSFFNHRIIIARPGDVRPLTPLEHLWSWLRAGLRLAGSVLAVVSVILLTLAGDAGRASARWGWLAGRWAVQRGSRLAWWAIKGMSLALGRALLAGGQGLMRLIVYGGQALWRAGIAFNRWFFSSLVRLTVTQLSIKAL